MDAAAPLEIGVETVTLHRAFSMLNVILLALLLPKIDSSFIHMHTINVVQH
jgi:hypothetical protein